MLEAAENSLKRLYPQFEIADHAGWDKAYSRAKLGSPDALKAVGDDGQPENNPVCKAIRGFIAGGKRGLEIRDHFEDAPFGWSRDAIDGGLQVLLVDGIIRGHDERGKPIDFKELERKAIGKATFKVESDTVTTQQRIQIRKLLQKAGIAAKHGEELPAVQQFLQKMQELGNRAGGDAPKPVSPDTSSLGEIRLTAGNSQLLTLYDRREKLSQIFDDWNKQASQIERLWPSWMILRNCSSSPVRPKRERKSGARPRQLRISVYCWPNPIGFCLWQSRSKMHYVESLPRSMRDMELRWRAKMHNWKLIHPGRSLRKANARRSGRAAGSTL